MLFLQFSKISFKVIFIDLFPCDSFISTSWFDFPHLQNIKSKNAGADITIDKVLHSRIPYANPLRIISEEV